MRIWCVDGGQTTYVRSAPYSPSTPIVAWTRANWETMSTFPYPYPSIKRMRLLMPLELYFGDSRCNKISIRISIIPTGTENGARSA